MTQNLKIEVLTGDISIDGMVVTNLVTKEELSTAIVKKADLGADGKIPTSQLPENILNTSTIVGEVKTELESTIQDAVQEANAYAESYVDDIVSKKADLTSGKVPLEQLPAIDQYPQFGTALSNLSTSILMSVKQRTDQLEKTKADLGEDGKVLREQIPSYEKISGLPEQLEVMSTQTAAVSGELDEHKLQTADQIDTLKENIEANVQQLTDRQSHLMRTYATKELGVDANVGVKPGEYFHVRSTEEDTVLVEYQNDKGTAVTTGKSYPSSAAIAGVAMDLQESKNLQDAKNIDSFSFDDILTQNEKANNKTTDLSVKLQSVFNDPNIKKIIFKRPYYINQLVTFNRNIEWEFVGDGEFVFGATGKIEGGGTAELIGKLPVAANKYTKSLSVPTGISAGDVICIYNPADFSLSPHRDYYRDGQFAMVADVVNGVATLYDMLYANYPTSCDIYKINRARVTIKNLKFSVNAPTNNIPITIHYAKVGIYGLQSTGSQRYGLFLNRCFGGDVISIDVKQFKAVSDGYQYAIAISNCQDLNVTGGNASASRHGVAFGSLGSECAVPNRNVTISNMTVMSTSASWGGADIHGNADNVKYINCTIQHSAIGGKNVSILDSTIYGRELDGLCSWFSELIGGVVEIKRCRLFSSVSGQGDFGFIYVKIAKDLREDLFLDIDDVTISAPNSTNLTHLINVLVENNLQLTKKINVSVNNIKGFDLPALRSILRFQFGSSGSTTKIPVGSVIVDNIKGIPESTLVFTISDWDVGYDLKLMKQSGSQVINTGNGAQTLVIGATTNFKYKYPIVPKLSLSSSTADNTWNSAFSTVPISAVATLRNNYIIPVIQAPSAMPADKSITVGWEVGI